MLGTVFVENLRIECIIGVHEAERQRLQPLHLRVELDTDIAAAATSDEIRHALDYSAVANLLRELAQSRGYRLIETFASEALQQVMKHFPCERVAIEIRKPNAIPDADAAGIRLERRRSEIPS